MRIHVTSAGKKWVEFAKKRLADLTRLRERLGLPKLIKAFVPKAGVMVQVIATRWGDTIRILAGEAAGRQHFSTISGVNTLHRFYRVVKGVLKDYTELVDGTSYSGFASYSFDGTTCAMVVSTGGSTTADASIDGTTVATMTAEPGTIDGAALTFGAPAAAGPGSIIQASQHIWPAVGPGLLENGSIVGMSYQRVTGTARQRSVALYHLDKNEDTEATEATLLERGLPQFVADFYAALPVPHSQGSLYTANLSPDRRFVRINGFLGVYEVSPADYLNPPEARLFYDPYGDQLGCVAVMPYVDSFAESIYSTVPLRYQLDATFKRRVELRLYNRTTGAWELEYAETAGFGTYVQVNLPAGALGGTTIDQATATWYAGVSRSPQAAVSFGERPRLIGMYPQSDFPVATPADIRVNGVTLFTTSVATEFVDTAGSVGYSRDGVWWGPWGETDTSTPSRFWPSATGDKAWTVYTTQYKYWESGVLKATIARGEPAAANAGNYPTYQAASVYGVTDAPSSFWGFRGWRYDEQAQAKMEVYTRIVLTPGGPGEVRRVQEGLVVVDGVGSFTVPSAPNADGLSLDGTLYIQNNGTFFTTFTTTELGALFGGAAVTYFPTGVQYDLTLSPTGDTYAWETKVVDVAWDGAALAAVSEYDATNVPVPSRDGLDEYIPATTTVDVSEASLTQDYLVMREPTS